MSERSERLVGAKFNIFDCIVKYSKHMLVLWGMAGMSERSERLVGGQIHPFFNYNPANGGSPPLVAYNFTPLGILKISLLSLS